MIVSVQEKAETPELLVNIICKTQDKEVKEILDFLHRDKNRLYVHAESNQNELLRQDEIYFIEAVDKRIFVYGKNKLYECGYKLYQLEEMLLETHFFRISKSVIVNIFKVFAMEPESGRRLKLTLDNEERLLVSRQYAGDFKKKLGIKGGKINEA